MKTEIWAHRGSSHTYIENTRAAFQRAIDDGAEGIELDVQRTKDGELIVYHDENFKRLTGVNKLVEESTWAEVQELTLSSPHVAHAEDKRIILLEEALLLTKDTALTINIELKNSNYFYPGIEEEVLECVDNIGMREQVLFSSFNHESMNRMSQLVGAERCAILTSDIQFEAWAYAERVGAKAIHPMINSMKQKDFVINCHKQGLKVHVWTADEEAHINGALLLGVNAIMTNLPEKAIQLRKQFQEDNGKSALASVQSLGLSI